MTRKGKRSRGDVQRVSWAPEAVGRAWPDAAGRARPTERPEPPERVRSIITSVTGAG